MTPPYDRVVHEVQIVPDTLLAHIVGQRRIGVNSYHHQAVRRLGRGLVVSARAEDGLVEAIERPASRFFVAVQWHPEWLYRTSVHAAWLFAAFVDAARERWGGASPSDEIDEGWLRAVVGL